MAEHGDFFIFTTETGGFNYSKLVDLTMKSDDLTIKDCDLTIQNW